jgi:hypothetical protein
VVSSVVGTVSWVGTSSHRKRDILFPFLPQFPDLPETFPLVGEFVYDEGPWEDAYKANIDDTDATLIIGQVRGTFFIDFFSNFV